MNINYLELKDIIKRFNPDIIKILVDLNLIKSSELNGY